MIITTCPHCNAINEVDVETVLVLCRTCARAYSLWDDADQPDEPDPDYGGAFDGFNVTSDADPGL